MVIKIKTYGALPCEVEVFTINGKAADLNDFGSVESQTAGEYRCVLNGFRYKMPTSDVLKKYAITLDEYAEIVEKLDEVFCYGFCGYCV